MIGSVLLLATLFVGADPNDLGCSGPNNWAASMAFVHLKNAGLVSNEVLDFDRTQVRLIAQQKIGNDLYRQVHHVSFARIEGGAIEVITSSNASSEECSMSGVQVFVVDKVLGDEP